MSAARLSLLALLVAVMFAPALTPASAQNSARNVGQSSARNPALDFKPLSDRKAAAADRKTARKTACSEYGAGFYRVEGSDTCVRIGGGIDVTIGSGGFDRGR